MAFFGCGCSRCDAVCRYYSQLWAQQNMLQDAVRTGIYHSAGDSRCCPKFYKASVGAACRAASDSVTHPVFMNASDFSGKTVLDVGAGSGM
jgi:2-polyprenyl-3-methyl-5-hydroxy-6-metoxy-1,4-benzoquinol methylase